MSPVTVEHYLPKIGCPQATPVHCVPCYCWAPYTKNWLPASYPCPLCPLLLLSTVYQKLAARKLPLSTVSLVTVGHRKVLPAIYPYPLCPLLLLNTFNWTWLPSYFCPLRPLLLLSSIANMNCPPATPSRQSDNSCGKRILKNRLMAPSLDLAPPHPAMPLT